MNNTKKGGNYFINYKHFLIRIAFGLVILALIWLLILDYEHYGFFRTLIE